MNVLLLGGTGTIGSAIVKELQVRGADVTTLCRNKESKEKAESLKITPLRGNIEKPREWCKKIKGFDCVIHVACGFDTNMGSIDKTLISSIIEASKEMQQKLKILYTGGVWCFGDTKGFIDEHADKKPIPEFKWMVENMEMLFACNNLHSIVIHPANAVKEENCFVPAILKEEHTRSGILAVPEKSSNYWPLVEVNNLAELYVLALDKASKNTEILGCAESGIKVGKLVKNLVEQNSITQIEEIPIAHWIKRYGAWANGYKLSQQINSRHAQDNLGWKPKALF